MNGIEKLFQSRKFWVSILNVVLIVLAFVLAQMLRLPDAVAVAIIGAITTAAMWLIITYTVEDVARVAFASAAAKSRK